MGKVKWILVAAALLALCGGQMMAGPGSDTRVFFDEDMTTNASAVLMGFAASLSDGTRTAISISNTTGAPDLEGLPEGGDSMGGVWLFCYNTLAADDGGVEPEPYSSEALVVYTPDFADPEMVGTGLDEDGMLAAGRTWLVYLDEALAAVAGDDVQPEPYAEAAENFVGYCYVVGEFDAIAGLSISSAGGAAFGISMTSDFTGAPVSVPAP